MTEDGQRVEVLRRIDAPAAHIFDILATPQRHVDLDGSGMLRGPVVNRRLSDVGDIFTMRMHRLGRDYLMINYVVVFEPHRRIAWEPAPGDLDTAGGDRTRIGIPSGYSWGYHLTPDGDGATFVTEVFDCGPAENRWILEREGGSWINGSNSVVVSMTATLEQLEKISTE